MRSINQVLNSAAMQQEYGSFYDSSPKLKLDTSKIPKELWPILPYAEFWGISDDSIREILVQNAPIEIQQNLKYVVTTSNAALDKWLAGDEAHKPNPTNEYVAFSAMRMAADFI